MKLAARSPRPPAATACVGLACILAFPPSGALAQAINLDFGNSIAVPGAAYGAAGNAGAWNGIGVLSPGVRKPLFGLDGAAVTADVSMIGGTALLEADDPATSGDDEALLDDMLIGFNDPVDVCIFFDGLEPGDYEVLVYAMTPADPSLESRVRVDFGTPHIVMVGGPWPGFHKVGVTFSSHTVEVTDGGLGLHSGLWAANIQSGINAIQLRPLGATDAGPGLGAAEPWLRAFPNPARGAQRLELAIRDHAIAPAGALAIHDTLGRLVWRESTSSGVDGFAAPRTVVWDGRDLAGRRVPAGVYFVRASRAGGDGVKLVRLD